MSPRLPLNPKKILSALLSVGFIIKRTAGSHTILYRAVDKKMVVIPMHAKDLPKGTAKSILNSAGLSLEEYLSL